MLVSVKRFLSFLPLFLSVCLFSCGGSDDRSLEEGAMRDTLQTTPPDVGPNIDGPTQITGLLQSSGLQPHEAKALGLPVDGYQLISQTAYFLKGHDSLQAFLGQCITLNGKMQQEWGKGSTEGGQTTYNRKLFVVEEVHPQLYSYCHYSDTTATQPQGKEIAYSGQVERMQRPAPDIAYDYQLRLQKPYRDQNHSVQPGMLVRTLPLETASFDVLSLLEAAVRQNKTVRIQGVQYQGYAEHQAVWVTAADSLAL